jgi:hypothetical protein
LVAAGFSLAPPRRDVPPNSKNFPRQKRDYFPLTLSLCPIGGEGTKRNSFNGPNNN